MKVKAKAGVLSKLLAIVARAAPTKRPAVPLLSGVLLEAGRTPNGDGLLTMSATDMEISITLGARAPVEEEGRAAVPARVLLDILKSLPNEEVLLSADGKTASVSRGKNAYELVAYPNPGEFPKLPEFPAEAAARPETKADTHGAGDEGGTSGGGPRDNAARVFTLQTAGLAAAAARVAPCVSDDERRPVLTGVLLSVGERGAATMVATDGYRLALDGAHQGGGGAGAATALIPGRALKEVARLCELGDEARVALTENAAVFSVRGVVLSTRLIEGNFPDYRKLLPDACEREFAVDAAALRDSLGRAYLIAGRQEPPAPVKLAFSGAGELTVSVRGAEAGRATETIAAEVPEGAAFDACFNPSSLLDGANAVGAEKIRFLVDDPAKPILMSGPAGAQDKGDGGQEGDRAAQSEPAAEGAGNDAHRPGEFLYMAMPVRDPAEGGAGPKAEAHTAPAG